MSKKRKHIRKHHGSGSGSRRGSGSGSHRGSVSGSCSDSWSGSCSGSGSGSCSGSGSGSRSGSGSGSCSGSGGKGGRCNSDSVILTFSNSHGNPVCTFNPSDDYGFGCKRAGNAVSVLACLYSKGFKIHSHTQHEDYITLVLVR